MRSRRACRSSIARSSWSSRRSFWRWAERRRRACSTPNSRLAGYVIRFTGSVASLWSSRITRPHCCATPTGRDQPGMTSVSPLASSTTERPGGGEYAGRQTPWSNDAEQAVLGAMVLDQDAALKAAEILDDSMFYREGHRLLFRSMLSLTERGDVIDPVTLRDELSRRGDLDRAGGMEYIAALIDVVPTAANVDYHAKIVRDKAVLRRLVEAATGIIQDVYEGHGTAGEVLRQAQHPAVQVVQVRRGEEVIRLKELVRPTIDRVEQLEFGPGQGTRVADGFC